MRAHHPRRRMPAGQRLQPGHRLGAIPRGHGGELAVPGAVMIEGVRHIGQPHIAPSPSIQSASTPAVEATRSGVLPETTNVLTTGAGF